MNKIKKCNRSITMGKVLQFDRSIKFNTTLCLICQESFGNDNAACTGERACLPLELIRQMVLERSPANKLKQLDNLATYFDDDE